MFNYLHYYKLDIHTTILAVTNNEFLNGIQQNFSTKSVSNYYFLFALAGLIVFMIILSNVTFSTKKNKTKTTKLIGNPETVFGELLTYIELTQDEQRLLKEMAKGSRILHPSTFMLSPSLLDWAREVWINEKGKKVSKTDIKGIDAISMKMFNTPTPSTESKIKKRAMQSKIDETVFKDIDQPPANSNIGNKQVKEIANAPAVAIKEIGAKEPKAAQQTDSEDNDNKDIQTFTF